MRIIIRFLIFTIISISLLLPQILFPKTGAVLAQECILPGMPGWEGQGITRERVTGFINPTDRIHLNWTDVPESDYYTIIFSDDGGITWKYSGTYLFHYLVSENGWLYVVAYKTYIFRITAHNSCGVGPYLEGYSYATLNTTPTLTRTPTPTNTPIPTSTPTLTLTPTSVPNLTPIPTRTPTPTPKFTLYTTPTVSPPPWVLPTISWKRPIFPIISLTTPTPGQIQPPRYIFPTIFLRPTVPFPRFIR